MRDEQRPTPFRPPTPRRTRWVIVTSIVAITAATLVGAGGVRASAGFDAVGVDSASSDTRDDHTCESGFPDVPSTHPFCAEIAWMVEDEITDGYPDGTFRPAAPLARQAATAFLFRYWNPPDANPPAMATFSDVPLDHPFFVEIEWFVMRNITTGYPDGTFRPTDTINRMTMAAFIYRLAQYEGYTAPAVPTFDDVPVSHPFYVEIEWMAEYYLANGFPDGTFRPTSALTRQAAAAFLIRLNDIPL